MSKAVRAILLNTEDKLHLKNKFKKLEETQVIKSVLFFNRHDKRVMSTVSGRFSSVTTVKHVTCPGRFTSAPVHLGAGHDVPKQKRKKLRFLESTSGVSESAERNFSFFRNVTGIDGVWRRRISVILPESTKISESPGTETVDLKKRVNAGPSQNVRLLKAHLACHWRSIFMEHKKQGDIENRLTRHIQTRGGQRSPAGGFKAGHFTVN